MFLQSLKLCFQKQQYFLGVPCLHATRPQPRYKTLLLLHKASRFGDVLLDTVKIIFEAHRPRVCLTNAAIGYFIEGMIDETSEAINYIARECKDLKGRIEDQRRVLEQLHIDERDAGQAEACLAVLLDEEAQKLGILDYLRAWRGDK